MIAQYLSRLMGSLRSCRVASSHIEPRNPVLERESGTAACVRNVNRVLQHSCDPELELAWPARLSRNAARSRSRDARSGRVHRVDLGKRRETVRESGPVILQQVVLGVRTRCRHSPLPVITPARFLSETGTAATPFGAVRP